MKIARKGIEYIDVTEDTINDYLDIPRVHLIRLMFNEPTADLIERVSMMYPDTNRYIINNNIRTYNHLLKNTTKKYYIENFRGQGLVSFFRRNNKCILNFNLLLMSEREFAFSNLFQDILRNVEVIILTQADFDYMRKDLESWQGNVLIDG